jgi:hypothetical protein
MSRLFSKFALLVALAGATLVGCTSHSVPIPPPVPESVVFSLNLEAGEASFQYDPTPAFAGATVYVFNRQAGEGVITTAEADGSVMETAAFPAMTGDEVIVTFETEGQLSSTCVTMQDGRSSSALECAP